MTIADPTGFLHRLGGLHDVWIDAIRIDTDAQTIALLLDDLNAAFTETTEYAGCQPGTLLMNGVFDLSFDVTFEEGLCISNAWVVEAGGHLQFRAALNAGGTSCDGHSVAVTFTTMEFQPTKGSMDVQTEQAKPTT